MRISLTPQSQIKSTQAIKFFHLVQQVFINTGTVLKINDFQSMVSILRQGHEFNQNILNAINRNGRQMNEQNFGIMMAQYLNEPIPSCQQLVNYNQSIRDVLLGSYIKKDSNYQLISQQFKPSVFDSQSLPLYEQQVQNFKLQIRYNISSLFQKTILKKINYGLSSIYYSHILFRKLMLEQLIMYVNNDFVLGLFQGLDNDTMLEDYYKCLLYLSQAGKIQEVKIELNKAGFFGTKVWQKHLACYYKFSNSDTEYLGTKSAIQAFIANYISICPQFGQFLINWLSMSPQQATKIILPSNLSPQQTFSVRYNLIIFAELLNLSTQNRLTNKVSLSNQNVKNMESFAMKVLSEGPALTVQASIKLISETVKFSLGDYYNDRNVGFILKALDTKQLQLPLVKKVLQVFQNSLRYNNTEIIWLFVKSQKCMTFIKKQLLMNFQGYDCLHCQCLQIIYLMALNPKLIISFQETGFFQIFLQIAKKTPFLLTFLSKIVLKIVELAIETTMLKIIPMKILLEILFVLMKFAGNKSDLFMNSFLNGNNYPYINKQIVINCLKIIYLLSQKSIKSDYKLFSQDSSADYALTIIKQMTNLVIFMKDRNDDVRFLRQKVQVKNQTSLKVFKLIFVVVQDIMRAHKGRSQADRRQFFERRNNLLASIYLCIDYHELQTEQIPIYIFFDLRFAHNRSFSRLLLSTISFQTFKVYILDVYNQIRRKREEPPVQNIDFVDDLNGSDVKSDYDFRNLIKKYTAKKQGQYKVALRIMFEQAAQRSPYHQRFRAEGVMREGYQRQGYDYRSVRVSPHSHGQGTYPHHQTERADRSRSPFRETHSSYRSDRSPSSVHMCERCKIVACPTGRLCPQCNRL